VPQAQPRFTMAQVRLLNWTSPMRRRIRRQSRDRGALQVFVVEFAVVVMVGKGRGRGCIGGETGSGDADGVVWGEEKVGRRLELFCLAPTRPCLKSL
jgi:hypothetical protein